MRKYRTLVAWQRARQLALSVLKSTDGLDHPRSRAIVDQLRRAAVSVEANIVEGYALGTAAQFKRHLRIALGSVAETEILLELGAESGYLTRRCDRENSTARRRNDSHAIRVTSETNVDDRVRILLP